MDHDAKAVANAFIELAKPSRLTNMQLQKLVYIAHGFTLALLDEPLFSDEVSAWEFGPVIPNLYYVLRKYGAGEVTESLQTGTPPVEKDSQEWRIIQAVANAYSKYSGIELSGMTHKPNSPWHQTWKPGRKARIPIDTIKSYYLQLFTEGAYVPTGTSTL